MTTHQNLALVQNLYQALGTFDVPAITRLVAPDVEWSVAAPEGTLPWAGAHRGPGGVLEYLTRLGDALEFGDFAITGLAVEGDRVIATGRDRGKARATGRPYDTEFVHVFTVDGEGRVVRFRCFLDSAALATALA